MTKTGFLCSGSEPVVETKAGKLRGFKRGSIYHFFGVDYGKAKRFQQPVEVEPWEGVKDALSYGYICPPDSPDSPNGDLLVPHRFWPKSEDCLNLNIWTPSIEKGAKKAVMVWMHGGLFSSGSAIEMTAFDGFNLAEYGDVVIVTVNHRLNVFGFLDVSAYGPEYYNSQNCGVADLALCLKWVHENISAFGGDPDNVTIFGQSGGGQKVSTMMQLAETEGCFQKAIIMSGSGRTEEYLTYDSNAAFAEKLVETAGSFENLVNMPLDEFIRLKDEKAQHRGIFLWGPKNNDWFDHVLLHGSTESAKKITLLVGSCLGEMATMATSVPGRDKMSKEEKEQMVIERFGKETAEKLLDLFYKAYPDHDALDVITLDDGCRTTTRMMLDQRAEDGSCPSYSYMFSYVFPFDDGKTAWHCSDIPFAFRNIDKSPVHNEAEVGERLMNQFSNAWLNFAKTGDPNNEYLPKWEPYTKGNEVTMILDRNCEARVDFDRELVEEHRKLRIEFKKPNMLM